MHEMVKRASRGKSDIITVQTPVKIDRNQRYKDAYDEYIDASSQQIITPPQPRYRRLYIVTENALATKKTAKDFLRKLIRTAIRKKAKSLDNVCLGFVKLDSALDQLFNNIDFHITSDKEFSVAFVPPAIEEDFGESIHILDIEKKMSAEMGELAKSMWKKAKFKLKLTAHYYSRNEEYSDIMKKLCTKVDIIIKKVNQ